MEKLISLYKLNVGEKMKKILLALSLMFSVSSFAHKSDIVDIAVGNDAFSTLVTAVVEADLVDALKGDGPFTVFAPTNDAFGLIPDADLQGLLADKAALTGVLTYHVLQGKFTADTIINQCAAHGCTAKTLQGENVTIRVFAGRVFVNDSQVVIADVEASNGVIHAIDRVLLP